MVSPRWTVLAVAVVFVGCGQARPAGDGDRDGEHAPLTLAAEGGVKPYPGSNDADGQAGSGAVAAAYRAGGRRVDAPDAPDARLFRTGYGAWEPTIGVTKSGTIFFATRNSNVDPGVARSTDDGRTWTRSDPVAHQTSLDPFIWVDRTTGRVFDSDIGPQDTCPPVSYSDDGTDWTTTTACGGTDYQKIFGGPPPRGGAQPTGYRDVVYFCSIAGGEGAGTSTFNLCQKSLDGGRTFTPTGSPSYPPRVAPPGSPPASPNCDGGAPPGFVGVDGTVYVPRGWCGEPWLAISHDEGDSWERVHLPGKPMLYDDADGAWPDDSGIAADRDGNLYYVWVADDLHPYLSVSRDGGRGWSAPLDILPPGVARTSNPAIDVGDPGRIAISFIGSEQPKTASPDSMRWNAYLAETVDALAADPTFYAASVNDPATNTLWKGDCPNAIRCGNMGDFYDVTIGPDGTPRGAFVDSCPGKDACTAFGVSDPRGEGIMGQLVGGPPLVGTVAQQTPAVTLPAARTCRSRRAFRIRLRQPRHGRLLRARVYVNGRRVKVVRGRRLTAPVDLRGLPKGTYVVRVVATTTTGRTVVRVHRYRTCVPRARAG